MFLCLFIIAYTDCQDPSRIFIGNDFSRFRLRRPHAANAAEFPVRTCASSCSKRQIFLLFAIVAAVPETKPAATSPINYPGASTQALRAAPTSPLTALAFFARSAPSKAGYASLFVPTSTHNHTGSFVPLSRYSDIASYIRLPGFSHNLLLLPHFHAHLLLLHNTQMTKNFLPIIFSLLPDIS